MDNNRFSQKISVFHGIKTPEAGLLVGYGAIIDTYNLVVPTPSVKLIVI